MAVYAVLPTPAPASPGYVRLSAEAPPNLVVAGNLLSLTRDPARDHKIGLVSRTLIWIGKTETVRLDSDPVPGARYPDAGSSAEIYTQADPLAYVELEMLGPVAELRPGDAEERTTTYTLGRRTANDPASEIRAMLRP